MSEALDKLLKQETAQRPVMFKETELKDDGRILYYYSFALSCQSQSQSSEEVSVDSEGAKK